MTRRVVLIGATGAFGARLARMLARVSGITLLPASRTLAKGQALARQLRDEGAIGAVEPMAFCHGPDAEARLRAAEPWLVIDASGPFQKSGYGTARAAVAARAHWIDLADAADYILGFADALDALAREAGVCAFTGASSTPALSSAAVARIAAGWKRVDDVEIGIYPAGGGDVGRAVIEAVLSYAGTPVSVLHDGAPAFVTGWGRAERVSIPALGARYRSAVATSDYALLGEQFGARNVRFYAGLESSLEHLGLVLVANARSRGVIKHTRWLAPLLHRARSVTRLNCGPTGGMLVQVRGRDALGRSAQGSWRLIARNGDGPNVPVLAALALTRKLLHQPLRSGAGPCVHALKLGEIEAEMAPFAIVSATTAPHSPLPAAA